jgi:hypothetical protein
MPVTKVSVNVLLVGSKTTTFRDVSVECGDDPRISMKATSKSVHLFPLGGPSCSPDPSSGMPSCRSSSVTLLGSISNSEGSPFFVMGHKTSSRDGTRSHLVKLRHDLLSLCHSCYWKINHRFIFDWLMSCPNYNLVLNYADSLKRLSSQDCEMGNTISIGIGIGI